MSTKEKILALGQAVTATRLCFPVATREVTYTTREMHRQLVTRRVFVGDTEAKNGWKLLARLVDYEFPGVRRGAETKSAWRGNKNLVRPLEWHHTPTPEELTAWEQKVRDHKGAGPVAGLAEQVEDLKARVARLEEQVEKLLAPDGMVVAQ